MQNAFYTTPMPSEYASATDLPPEITARIVELLSGRQPNTWERNPSEACPPLELSKRELGRCSLVCKFWAGFLRRDIFRRLSLRTLEDGDQFCSFITSPSANVETRSSLARLVQRLDLYYDLAGPPWVHRIFMSRCKLDQRVEIYVTVSDSSDSSSPVLARSIYHSLPRSLPQQMTHIKGLSLRGLSFADPSSLRRFLISVDLPSWPKIVFDNVHVKDTGTFPSQHCRSITFATLRVRDGRAPLRILSSCSTSNWAQTDRPQPPTLAVLEKVLFTVMRTCPVTAAWASPEAEDRNAVEIEGGHQHDRAFDCELMHDSFKISGWCPRENAIQSIEVHLSREGGISSVSLAVESCKQAISFPWGQLDEDLWALIPDVRMLIVEIDDEEGRNAAMKAISRRMPHFVTANKLKFRWYLEDEFDEDSDGGSDEDRHIFVDPVGPDETEDEGVDEENSSEDEDEE